MKCKSTNLVEARCEQVAGGEDAAVGPQPVLLHHVLVLDLINTGKAGGVEGRGGDR